ncbi:hypothetical protein OAI07_01295 [Akkermansiaceae bacterium]|nr:hypothetical protein [Akkermansiaceae bacterium]
MGVITPYNQARLMYEEAGLDDFELDIQRYAREGYITATPLEFAMARPVSSKWGELQIQYIELEDQLTLNDLTLIHDCWYINCVVGDLRSLMASLPYYLPLIAMVRRGRFKIYKTSRFL